jgi:hypothetical protein
MTVEETVAPNGCRFARIADRRSSLGLISWRNLLTEILGAVEQAGEQAIASDVRQLQGLCDREDSEAFLPLESEELTSGSIPRRLSQFCELVDDLTSRLVGTPIGDVNRLRATVGKGSYGRYIRLHGVPSLILFSAQLWASKHPTPIWLRAYGSDWKPNPGAMERLSKFALISGYQAFKSAEGMNFPIILPTGVERDEVLKQAEAQILNYAVMLKEAVPVSSESLAPPLTSDFEESEDSPISV